VTYGLSYTPLQALNPSDGPFTWHVETIDSQSNVGLIQASSSWPSFYLDAPTTGTSLSLLTPLNGASALRMPSMTWTPYTGASYYEVLYGVTSGIFNATPLSGGTHLLFAGFTYTAVPKAAAKYYWEVEAFDAGDNVLKTSSMGSFYVGTTPAYGDWIIPWNDYLTPECQAQTDPSISRCTPLLGQTQEMTWTPDPNAGAYLVYVAKDVNFTNIYREYETGQTSLTPRESWLDSQAGESYYWFVRPCVDWQAQHCGPGPDTNAGLDNSSAYRKSSPAENDLTTTTAANPPVAATTIPNQVTFNWADYMTTSQASPYPVTGMKSTRVTQEAKQYTIQVSTTSDFTNIIDTRTVDQTQYTPWTETYPEGPLYWRVQALDGSGNPLTMSLTKSVTKASPPITLTSPTNAKTVTGVPYFTWAPQTWAAKYTIEVYKNGDLNFSATNRIFSVTTFIAAWSPTANMPAGVYAWRVQRIDASNRLGPWSTGRTFTLKPSAPTLNTPADQALLDGVNMDFTWLGVQGAVSYQFQSSTAADFSSGNVENQTTVMTAWSPTMQYNAGVYYWRVNLLDASNNVLSTSSSRKFTVGTLPGAPTGPTATAGNAAATVYWTAPSSSGSSTITGYIVTSTPGGKNCTTTGLTHCTVGLLTNGTAYTFHVQAITSVGTGPASGESNSVVPKAVSTFTVSAGLTQAPGVAFNVVVTATDGLGATQSGYRGTVHFTSSDGAAVLPANYTFTSVDLGIHTFSVKLNTPGTQSVTVTDTVTSSITGSRTGIVVSSTASTYHATNPARVLDSRPTASGHTNIGLSGKFVAGSVRTFAVTGVIGVGASSVAVPSNASAVTGNLTIVNETTGGLIALGPTMTPTGETTTLNFAKGDIRANNVTVGLGPGGKLSAVFRSSTGGATTDLIFDVTGYFTPNTSGATYHTVAPGRVLDSRKTASGHTNIGLSGKFANKTVRTFAVAGVKGIGWSSALVPSGATAVTGNLTVTNATSVGYVSVGPTIAAVPKTSTLNVAAGANVANGVTVALKSGKLQAVWDGTAGSSADVIFDVTGYFTADLTGLSFYPIAPARLLDTATGRGLSGSFTNRTPRTLTVDGVGAIPAAGRGISGNLTIVNPSSGGFAFVSPATVATPTSSTLNANPNQTIANGFDVALSSGKLALIWCGTVGSTAGLELDVTGYWK
jgi:cytochrome c oxidase assembly protein Cox11